MTYIVITIISIGILYYVVYPLRRPKYRFAGIPGDSGDNRISSLQQSKNETLKAIKEIDFEYQMGNLSEEDYESLKADYQDRALQILQKIDQLQNGNQDDDPIEAEIRRYRQQINQPDATHKSLHYCQQCGEKIQADFKFCVNCGRPLQTNGKQEIQI